MGRSIVRGPVLEVRTPAELETIGRDGRPITLVGWPADSRAAHDDRLTKWATACGCDTGAAAMLLFGVIAVVAVVFDLASNGLASLGLVHPAAVLGALIGGALVGKAVGLLWAGIRWRQAVKAAITDYAPVPAE